MKKLLVILACLVVLGGCTHKIIPLRSQLHSGMLITEVWELHGYDSGDPNTYKLIDFEIIKEQQTDSCIFKTYRHWLYSTDKKSIWGTLPLSAKKPYLLTFQSCQLPNYEEVQLEKKRRLEFIRSEPEMRQEFDSFCEENKFVSEEDQEFLAEILTIKRFGPLPRCMTDSKLIQINLDENKIAYEERKRQDSELLNSLSGIQQQQQEIRRQMEWQQMQEFNRQAIEDFHRMQQSQR